MPLNRSKQPVFQLPHRLKFCIAMTDAGADSCADALTRNDSDL